MPAATEPSFELYQQVVHPDDRLDFSDPVKVAGSGGLTRREFRIIRPSGELRWVRSFGEVLHDGTGAPERMIGFAYDATSIRRAEAAAHEHDAILAALRKLFGGVIWRTAPDGTVVDELEWWLSVEGGPPKGKAG